jgi:hypothetical protein
MRDDEERSPRRQVKPDDLAIAATSWAPDPQGDCGSARAASRRQPCLPRPWSARPRSVAPGPRRCEALDQRPVSVRRVALLGFLASSVPSRLRASRQPWLPCAAPPCEGRDHARRFRRRGERLVSECPTLPRAGHDSLALAGPPRRHRVGRPVPPASLTHLRWTRATSDRHAHEHRFPILTCVPATMTRLPRPCGHGLYSIFLGPCDGRYVGSRQQDTAAKPACRAHTVPNTRQPHAT